MKDYLRYTLTVTAILVIAWLILALATVTFRAISPPDPYHTIDSISTMGFKALDTLYASPDGGIVNRPHYKGQDHIGIVVKAGEVDGQIKLKTHFSKY